LWHAWVAWGDMIHVSRRVVIIRAHWIAHVALHLPRHSVLYKGYFKSPTSCNSSPIALRKGCTYVLSCGRRYKRRIQLICGNRLDISKIRRSMWHSGTPADTVASVLVIICRPRSLVLWPHICWSATRLIWARIATTSSITAATTIMLLLLRVLVCTISLIPAPTTRHSSSAVADLRGAGFRVCRLGGIPSMMGEHRSRTLGRH